MNAHRLVKNHLLKRSCLSFLLYPLGELYAFIQTLRRAKMQNKAWHAPCKIISIGNLTAGGSGKTPLTIALARMLKDSGLQVAVSHRGYKGMYENFPTLVSTRDKILYPAENIGDEAHLIATALPGIPVVVGRQRKAAIKLMLKLFPKTQVIVLDDSFQHLNVFHDLNILSFCTETGLGNGFILPAGYLRESLKAISPPDWAVIYSRQGQAKKPPWEKQILMHTANLFYTYSTISHYQNPEGEMFPVEALKGKKITLVSGIASPASFEKTVRGLGLSFTVHHAYPDHYAFSSDKCLAELSAEPAEKLLCTQKDLMKLARHNELAPRLAALVQDYHFEAEEEFRSRLLESISG